MIISKTVFVQVAGQRSYYINKGYNLTPYMYKNRKGKMVIPRGTIIEVRVDDLPPRSSRKVLAQCDNPKCKKERWVEYEKYTSLCHRCALQTESYKTNNGNANRGKKRTAGQKERKRKPNYLVRGKNNINWNKNISEKDRLKTNEKSRNSVEYRAWRLSVFRKNCYQCQNCGYTGRKINAHHIESYFTNKDLRFDADNGIVLCTNCHKLFHSTYGKTGNHKYQLDKFLKNNKNKKEFVKLKFDIHKDTRQGRKNVNNNDSSIYVGVSKNKNRKKWEAGIYHDKIKYYLGMFEYEVEAAMAYNEAASEIWGWKAILNKITEDDIIKLWEN